MPIEDLLHPLLKHYLEAPRWLSASAGRAYALLPQGLRIGSAYASFRDEIAQAQGRVAAWRLARRKLENTLRWAIETVPAYRRYAKLLDEIEDPADLLAQLPVTGKLDIKRDPNHYLSGAMPVSKRLRMFTGGSTLNPLQFYLQRDLSRPKEYAFMQCFRERVGAGANELTLSLRGRSVPSAARKGGCLWMLEPIKRQLVLSSDHLEERYMPQYASILLEHKPAFIEAFPSALYPLARGRDDGQAVGEASRVELLDRVCWSGGRLPGSVRGWPVHGAAWLRHPRLPAGEFGHARLGAAGSRHGRPTRDRLRRPFLAARGRGLAWHGQRLTQGYAGLYAAPWCASVRRRRGAAARLCRPSGGHRPRPVASARGTRAPPGRTDLGHEGPALRDLRRRRGRADRRPLRPAR